MEVMKVECAALLGHRKYPPPPQYDEIMLIMHTEHYLVCFFLLIFFSCLPTHDVDNKKFNMAVVQTGNSVIVIGGEHHGQRVDMLDTTTSV